MTRQMRVGIVGGQKKKTESHLFKSLEEIGIEVAWHVEAMTNREFSRDCDAIVSMVDYVGHGLFAKAKDFARLNGIPFRQITFNWSKAKPTFEELQDKFNIQKNMEEDMVMQKVINQNPDFVKVEEISALVGYSTPTIRKAYEEGLISRQEQQVGSRIIHFYSKSESEKFFAKRREKEAETKRDTETAKPVEIRDLTLCRIKDGVFDPIIDVSSTDTEEIAAAISLAGGEGDFVVVSVVKKFKAKVKLTVEEV